MAGLGKHTKCEVTVRQFAVEGMMASRWQGSDGEQLPLHDVEDVLRIVPPSPEQQAQRHLWRKLDANDVLHRSGPGALRRLLLSPEGQQAFKVLFRRRSGIQTAGELVDENPKLREPVIDGVLRRGEIMNLIASSKAGKSVLSINLAMCCITGGKWFGRFACTPGRVLLVDNELHRETISHRLKLIAAAMHVPPPHWRDAVHYRPMRGALMDVEQFGEVVRGISPGYYRLLVMDAFYKFYPPKTDENDNAAIARIYGVLDKYADDLDCAFVLIHHTSKGIQAGKSVTDVGAGSSSMGRACDVHMVLREHEEPGVFVVDAALRSFAPFANFCVKLKYPTWVLSGDQNPDELKGKKESAPSAARAQQMADEYSRFQQWADESVMRPATAQEIAALVEQQNLGIAAWTDRKARDFCRRAVIAGALRVARGHAGSLPDQYISVHPTVNWGGQQAPAEAPPGNETPAPDDDPGQDDMGDDENR
jgi:hypothetical protein